METSSNIKIEVMKKQAFAKWDTAKKLVNWMVCGGMLFYLSAELKFFNIKVKSAEVG